jgi:hypothetical protein
MAVNGHFIRTGEDSVDDQATWSGSSRSPLDIDVDKKPATTPPSPTSSTVRSPPATTHDHSVVWKNVNDPRLRTGSPRRLHVREHPPQRQPQRAPRRAEAQRPGHTGDEQRRQDRHVEPALGHEQRRHADVPHPVSAQTVRGGHVPSRTHDLRELPVRLVPGPDQLRQLVAGHARRLGLGQRLRCLDHVGDRVPGRPLGLAHLDGEPPRPQAQWNRQPPAALDRTPGQHDPAQPRADGSGLLTARQPADTDTSHAER